MLELMMAQLRKMGFDPEVAKTQIATAVGDIHQMKLSQDRTEAMVKAIYDDYYSDPNAPSQNITVAKEIVLGKVAP